MRWAQRRPLPSEQAGRRSLLRRAWPIYASAAVLAAVAFLIWNVTPLRERTSGRGLSELIAAAQRAPFAFLWVLGAYALGALAFIPVTALVVLTAAVFPNWKGFMLIVAGTALNCEVGYGLGRALGRRVVRRFFRDGYDALVEQLGAVDTWKLFVVRFFPITPFATMNVVCGTARLAHGPFLISGVGSVIPGAVFLIAFQGAFEKMGGSALPAMGIGLLVLFSVPYLLKALLRRRPSPDAR